MQVDDPPSLPVGTDVSAKYKGAFCEAKISKVVRVVKLKVTYKGAGLGSAILTDEQVRSPDGPGNPILLRVGQYVLAKHNDKKEFIDATITKIQDCSQYTVVFDDGDITTLRRTALCLKSGRHFNESETLDQLPLTHPEHFGNPVVGGRRGRRSRQMKEDSSDAEGDDEDIEGTESEPGNAATDSWYKRNVRKVVYMEASDNKRKSRDSWYLGLVVAPNASPKHHINPREECLIRSFKNDLFYTVPKNEIREFKRDAVARMGNSPADAVDKAMQYLDKAELPPHWDEDTLFNFQSVESETDDNFSDSSDDEPREEKDHFVARLYKFMDDCGTPLNKGPVVLNRDMDLCRMFRTVEKLGGYNRVTNKGKWKTVAVKLGFASSAENASNPVKQAYKKFLFSFEEFNRKLGCTMVPHPRSAKKNQGRSLIRDRDRMTPVNTNSNVNSPRPEKVVEKPVEKKEEPEKVEKPDETVKRKSKPETSVKSKDDGAKSRVQPESSDSCSTDGTVEMCPEPSKSTPKPTEPSAPKGKKIAEPKTATKVSKVKSATGTKVKALIEKFEEQAKPEEKEEDKVQQTRSKSSGPKKELPTSPDRKMRESRTPMRDPGCSKTAMVKLQRSKSNSRVPIPEDDKKRGRKKKDSDDKTSSDSSCTETPLITNVNVNDKLKVYYGPNLESKVTYEAKVLEIDRDDAGPVYLVHYTGWNNRYDEWIKPSRIADNISQTTKAKRLSKNASSAQPPSKSSSRQPAVKRGRGTSTSSRTNSQDPPRSTTPSSVTSNSSRTKSPATPALRAPSARLAKQAESAGRRSVRRTSAATDSDSMGSESDEVPKRKMLKRKEETTPERSLNSNDDQVENRPKRLRKTPKKSTENKMPASVESDDDTKSSPKGRDYDLNQIRSELKGFVKMTPSVETEVQKSTAPTANVETKVVDVKNKLQGPSVTEIKEEKVCKVEKESENEKDNTEDIYEFKEPEPFEFESRSKLADDKIKKRSPRLYDDIEKPVEKTSPFKKKPAKSPSKVDTKQNDPDKKPRFRRNLCRKIDENVEKSPGKSTDDDNSKSKSLSVVEDAFDKLVESPSFNIAPLSDKKPLSCLSPVHEKDKSVKTITDEPLRNLFEDLPEPDDSNDVAISIGESEPTEPLFAHQPTDNLFPTNISDIFTSSDKDTKECSSLVPIFRGFNKPSPTEVKNSDEEDPIDAAIQRVTLFSSSKDDDSNDDQLLINHPTTSYQPKFADVKKEITATIKIAQEVKEMPVVELSKPLTILGTTIPVKTDQEVVTSPPVKKEPTEKPKQISPALQESDSSILDKVMASKLIKTEQHLDMSIKTGTKIADSILDKFNTIKKKEESMPPAKVDTKKEKEVQIQIANKIVELKQEPKVENIENEVKVKEDVDEIPVTPVVETYKKRSTYKSSSYKSREFISDDSDSSDSEERLVIARSDDESQISRDDSNLAEPKADLKDSDSDAFALQMNIEESSQEASKPMDFEDTSNAKEDKSFPIKPESIKTEEEPDSNISLLLCEETIPGSPAPVVDAPQPPSLENRKMKSAKNLMLEMPFASAPGSSNSKALLSEQMKHAASSSLINKSTVELKVVPSVREQLMQAVVVPSPLDQRGDDAAPVMDNTPPTTPESSISNSPRGERGGSSPGTADDSSKSQRDSETGEADQYNPRPSSNKPAHYSEEDTLLNSDTTSLDIRVKKSPRDDMTGSGSGRKRKRSFKGEHDAVQPNAPKRGRRPNSIKTAIMIRAITGSDSDDTQSEHSVASGSATPSNAADSRLAPPPQRSSKYNFIVDIDVIPDRNQKIALLQQKMSELRKAYNDVKTELACIDRRRKKLRRREREAMKAAKQEMACT